jgi:hypothetical protein
MRWTPTTPNSPREMALGLLDESVVVASAARRLL